MNPRVSRIVAVCAVFALFAAYQARADRGGGASSTHELSPQVRSAGLTFAPGVAERDRQWVLAAIAKARPEAQRLIGAVDGLVTISTINEPGAPFVGVAHQGSDDIELNVAFLDGERVQDRDQSVLHELAHIVDFELVPDDQMRALAAQIPASGGCVTPERGDCTAPEERFADTFAKWALRGAVSGFGAGYGVSTPASLEAWGAPLGALAAQVSVSA
jgi:hypothetical protein